MLADNVTSNPTVTANGNFIFAAALPTGATYDVTVVTQPSGQTCTVANGSGSVDPVNNVSNVAVTCGASASIAGTVSGLGAARA